MAELSPGRNLQNFQIDVRIELSPSGVSDERSRRSRCRRVVFGCGRRRVEGSWRAWRTPAEEEGRRAFLPASMLVNPYVLNHAADRSAGARGVRLETEMKRSKQAQKLP